jgi:hypothetical protein
MQRRFTSLCFEIWRRVSWIWFTLQCTYFIHVILQHTRISNRRMPSSLGKMWKDFVFTQSRYYGDFVTYRSAGKFLALQCADRSAERHRKPLGCDTIWYECFAETYVSIFKVHSNFCHISNSCGVTFVLNAYDLSIKNVSIVCHWFVVFIKRRS